MRLIARSGRPYSRSFRVSPRRHSCRPTSSPCLSINGFIRGVVALILSGVVWTGCSSSETDSEAIHRLIDAGAMLAEAHDVAGLLALTTDDVRAMPMDLARSGIKGVLWRTFKHYGPLAILYPRPTLAIDEDGRHASASVIFLIVKKEHSLPSLEGLRDDPMAWAEAVGETADLYRLKLSVVKRDDDWRVHRATLERFTGLGFD